MPWLNTFYTIVVLQFEVVGREAVLNFMASLAIVEFKS